VSELWEDKGRASQGKIVTNVLQGRSALAMDLLGAWTPQDREALGDACRVIERIVRELNNRE
jgi:hypothetical protein